MKTSKHVFFCDDINSQALSKEESHHATKVLRLKIGDGIQIMDGIGTIANAHITDANKQNLSFKIDSKRTFDPPHINLHIAIAPTKSNDRIAFFLEKCTEIGISTITPILCENSERKNINLERWQKIITSAAKQSQNSFLPRLNKLEKIDDFLAESRSGSLFIAHCEDTDHKQELKNHLVKQKEILILIGPEGDFTKEEINLALEKNYKPISLGTTRLRTETAGIVACHTVNLLL
jgi:16S rRNA (uracil1498-N3)-methyltransferase